MPAHRSGYPRITLIDANFLLPEPRRCHKCRQSSEIIHGLRELATNPNLNLEP
jgi:hypothetical protein